MCSAVKRLLVAMMMASVFGGALLSPAAFADIPPSGAIQGKVTAQDGTTPLGNVQVRVYLYNPVDEDWDLAQTVFTQTDGTYSFQGLATGGARIRFHDPGGAYKTEYYNDSATLSGAQEIAVAASGTINGINASLSAIGRIVGMVTGSDGTPLDNAYVGLHRWNEEDEEWQWETEAYTREDGTYVAGWLRAGVYRVRFSDDYHVTEYYNGVPDFGLATDLVVTTGTVSGIDASMADKAMISGKVTGPDGVTPLENIQVTTYGQSSPGNDWYSGREAYTAADGTYTIRGVEPGINRVQFSDPDGDYLAEYHENAATRDDAQDILAGNSGTVGGINASLAAAGRIAGKVTGPDGVSPLKEIYVIVYQWNEEEESWDQKSAGITRADGTYSAGGMLGGTYRVLFFDNTGDHASEYYDNAPDVDTADDVVVVLGAATGGIDASLAMSGRISGKVTGADGTTPLREVTVSCFRWNSDRARWDLAGAAFPEEDGSYSTGGLLAGVYRLGFSNWSGDYVDEYYQNVPDLDSASDLTVQVGTVLSGIDASLAEKGKVSGTVTGADGVTPLEGIEVVAYVHEDGQEEWDDVRKVRTSADGSYLLHGLDSGTVRIGFHDKDRVFLPEFYEDAATLAGAQDISVTASNTVQGIDASLSLAGSIAGTVTGPDGITPLNDVNVSIYRWSAGPGEWESVDYSVTDANGHYVVRGLAGGSYRVGFFDTSLTYVGEYHNNMPDLDSSSDVEVSQGTTTAGIDASLAEWGRITGVVTGPDNLTPLKGIRVTVHLYSSWSDSWYAAAETVTRADGNYIVSRLYPGTVRLQFEDPDGNHLSEYYNDASSLEEADEIEVPWGQVGGVNASLSLAGRIAGKVTGADGVTVLEDVSVYAYRWDVENQRWSFVTNVPTGADGHYVIHGLAAGPYGVGFRDNSEIHRDEYFDNAASLLDAALVEVSAGSATDGIDASLAERTRITGRVTGADNVTPLKGIAVTAFRYEAFDEQWNEYLTTTTLSDGTYVLQDIDAGSVRLRFEDPKGKFSGEYYNNSPSLDGAEDLVVTSGTLGGINATLNTLNPVAPVVTGLRNSGPGSLALDFEGGFGTFYQLQQSTDLRLWEDHGDPVRGYHGGNSVPLEIDGPQKFWRIRTLP